MTEQVCAYEKCSETFAPKRPHQRFHHRDCRYAQWDLERERGDAQGSGQRVEEGVRRLSRDGKGTKVYLTLGDIVGLQLGRPNARTARKLTRATSRLLGDGR